MMDNYPRTLSSFFMDGSPAGRVLYTLSNWSGAGLRIPRDLVRLTSQTRTELYRTGVYLLFGKDSKNPNQARARAGQGGILKQRLFDHLATIDWWDECVVFFANDGSLNTGHTRYLELMLIREAKKAGKYLVTQNEPSEDTFDLTEQDRAQVDEFFSYVKLIMSSVGHPVLQQEKTPQTEEESVFVIRSKLDDGTAFEAMGRKSIGAQFEILAGSIANKTVSRAVSFSALSAVRKKDIEDLLSNGVIVDKGDYYEFEKNHRFSSPSYAAVIVLGRNVSGLTEWKCASLTLRDYEFEQNSALTAQC